MTTTFTISPRGPFSLEEATLFGFGQRAEQRFDGVMRLGFCVDGYTDQVGVALGQDADGTVHGTVQGLAGRGAWSRRGLPAVREQVARVLSLDHDGRDFLGVGGVDPAIGRLQRRAPGLRPVLFYSPYEAAVWAVLNARRGRAQAAALRDRLSRAYGTVFEVAGVEQAVLPTPERLLTVDSLPGLPQHKVAWLHGVAAAALAGRLDAGKLAATEPEEAMAGLRQLAGIGPFYAALIQIRATGAADILPSEERNALGLAGELYGLAGPMSQTEFAERAEAWRPWRTWATVLIRAVTPRLRRSAAA
jgi:DNA-3-methyladenine glycosylase II